MLFVIIGIIVLLIFPICINVKAFFSLKDKKIYFLIQLFGFIKILGGYITFDKVGIVLHLSDKKAVILFYSKLLNVKDKIKPLKDYHLVKFNYVLDIGLKNEIFLSVLFANFLNTLTNVLGQVIVSKKPYFDCKSKINLIETFDRINLFINSAVLFNGVVLLGSIIKIMIGKIVYGRK